MFLDDSYSQLVQGSICRLKRFVEGLDDPAKHFEYLRKSAIVHNISKNNSFFESPKVFWEKKSVAKACLATLLSTKVWCKVADAVTVVAGLVFISIAIVLGPLPLTRDAKFVVVVYITLKVALGCLKNLRRCIESVFDGGLRPVAPAGVVVLREETGLSKTTIEQLQNETIDDCLLMPGTQYGIFKDELQSPRIILINSRAYDALKILHDYLHFSCDESDELFFAGTLVEASEECRNKVFKQCARLLCLEEAIIKGVCEAPFTPYMERVLESIKNQIVASELAPWRSFRTQRFKQKLRDREADLRATNPQGFLCPFDFAYRTEAAKLTPTIELACEFFIRAKPILKDLPLQAIEQLYGSPLTELEKVCFRAVMRADF